MIKILSRFVSYIRRRFYNFKLLSLDDTPLQTAGKESQTQESTVKECTRDAQTLKRAIKSFDQQQQQMKNRRSAHMYNCKDTLSCIGCYKLVPDEIASKPYKVKKRIK